MTAKQDEDEERKKLARGMQDADRSAKALKQALKDAADAAKEEAKAREKSIDGLKETARGIASAGVSALGQRGAGTEDLKAAVFGGIVDSLPALGALLGSVVGSYFGPAGAAAGSAIGAGGGKLAQAYGQQSQPAQEIEARKTAIAETAAFTKSRAEAGVPVSPEQSAQIFAAYFAKEMRALDNERQTRQSAQAPVLRMR